MRQQPQKAPKRCRNAFAAVFNVIKRQNMAQDRRRHHKREHQRVFGQFSAAVQKNRQKALEQVAAQRKHAAPEPTVCKRIHCARVLVRAFRHNVCLFKDQPTEPRKQNTAQEIPENNI